MSLPKIKIIITACLYILTSACGAKHIPVTVTVSDGLYTFSYKEITFGVSAKTGGRIISYACDGKELLIPSSVHSENYGATLWPSPQSAWGWPPSPVLDLEAYEATLVKDTLLLVSQPDSTNGYLFKKKFYINTKDHSVNIVYSITNISEKQKQVAAWDVLRTTPYISFFPVENSSVSLPQSNLKSITVENGILWFTFCPDSIPQSQKLFSTAKGGWLAHAGNNGLLFIKTFPDITDSAIPPGESEVEIYASKQGLYIELENHGSYTMLQPGETLNYPEKWYLVEIDETRGHETLLQKVYEKLKLK